MNQTNLIIYFYSQIALIFVLLYFLKNSLPKYKSLVASIAVFCVVFQFALFFVFNSFTGKGFDESVRYHLLAGFIGLTRRLIVIYALNGILALTVCTLVARFTFKKVKGENTSKLKNILHGLLVLSIFFNPLTINVFSFINHPSVTDESELEKHFTLVNSIKLREGEKKKNLIYIYLESFEKAYTDQNLYPDLAPNLARLAEENKDFTQIRQVWGTGWTIAGMVASQCGMPLASFGNKRNQLGKLTSFMPSAVCIGDLLKEEGYYLSYVGGADLGFAGKGHFYKTHGFKDIYGQDELKEKINLDSDSLHHWGVYDGDVFDYVLKKVKVLEDQKTPYLQMALTVETHGPYLARSKQCKDLDYGIYKGDKIMESYRCSDHVVGLFVEELKKIIDPNSTQIIIASDHLYMGSMKEDSGLKDDRSNLFILLDGSKSKDNKDANMMDVAPTILSLLGYDVDKFGFGRNMNVEDKDFLPQEVNSDYLQSIEKLMIRFWDNP